MNYTSNIGTNYDRSHVLTSTEKDVLCFLTANPGKDAEDISNYLQIGHFQALDVCNSLVERGILSV